MPRDLNIGAFLWSSQLQYPLRLKSESSPQHIWHNEQAHVRSSDVHPVEVGNPSITLRDVDVLKLDVHVVFGFVKNIISVLSPVYRACASAVTRTFDQFAAICLAGCDFDSDLVTLQKPTSAVVQGVSTVQ